jgi:uncharacterized protein YggU (UPF0235/DUF167 family)
MVETMRLRLRVSPGADRTEIVGRYGDGWKVRVAVAPEQGRANDAVIRLLAEALDIDPGRLTLVGGSASRNKLIELRGLDPAEAERRLERSR